MPGCVESRRKCRGEAAILHSSIRNQEGITIEAEETQRQLDPDSGVTDIPAVSKCMEELHFRLCVWRLCMCMWAWRPGAEVTSPPQSISLTEPRDSFKLAGQRIGGLWTAAPSCGFYVAAGIRTQFPTLVQ